MELDIYILSIRLFAPARGVSLKRGKTKAVPTGTVRQRLISEASLAEMASLFLAFELILQN